MEISVLLSFESRGQLRDWLLANHGVARECWVAAYRGKVPPVLPALPYVEIVEEALCFGWIDSTVKKLPDGRLAQRLSPRRKNSHWTDLNVARCKILAGQGLMMPAGLAAMPSIAGRRSIRKAVAADIPVMLKILDSGRRKMRAEGNDAQWVGYPRRETLEEDIRRGCGFMVEENGRPVATFALVPSPEPTYAKIYEGRWLDEPRPYHVIHRIASVPDVHGVMADILAYAFALTDNIRIDTHRKNSTMRKLLARYGFSYCGIIYLLDGAERLAFQKCTAMREE